MVDGFTATCRLQQRRVIPQEDATMAADESDFNDEEQGGDEDFPRGAEGTGAGGGLAGFAVGVIFGAVLGAGLALMYAPERGEKTRKQLKRRLHRLRREAEEGLDSAGERTKRELLRGKRRIESGLDRAAHRAREALE
jgi:YtxH-like protein